MSSTGISSWFNGIKGKLLFAAALPVIGFAILGVVSTSGLSKVAGLLDTSNHVIIPTFDAIGDLDGSRHQFNARMWSSTTSALTKEEKTATLKIARENIEAYKKAAVYYASTPMDGEELKRWQETKPLIDSFVAASEKVLSLVETTEAENIKLAQEQMNGPLKAMNDKLDSWIDFLNDMYKKQAKESSESSIEIQAFVRNMLLGVTATACLAIFAVLLIIASKVSNSVSSISSRLADSSAQVATAVTQLNAAGNTLSASSTEAAASLEETVASLEEMTSMVRMGSDNAKQAAALALSSCDSAETGAQEIQNLIKSMNQISSSSKKIEEIISVIDDIAFQTNLLALNAAVEAARAGEQGKGFAVVADAVRALAQRSASSAKDISGLIKDSVSQIEEGSEIADKSGTILSSILTSIKKVSDLNNEIAAASQEQATGIEQINKAMSQLDQAGQANAASAEEIAAASGEISHLADTTQSLTVELNNVVLGNTSAAPTTAPTRVTTTTKPVVKKATAAVAKIDASNVIPFSPEEAADRGKIGNASGF